MKAVRVCLPALLLLTGAGAAQAQVELLSTVSAQSSETYQAVNNGSHVCAPGAAPTPGDRCVASDSRSSKGADELLTAHAKLQIPQTIGSTNPASIYESESTSYQHLVKTSRGLLKQFEGQLHAATDVLGPNNGLSMGSGGGASQVLKFKVQGLLATRAQIGGRFNARASGRLNAYTSWLPSKATVRVRLERAVLFGSPEVVFEKELSSSDSSGNVLELLLAETLSLRSGDYTLSFSGSSNVGHFGSAYSSIGFGQRSSAEIDGEFQITLSSLQLFLFP